jgi:hypothetical protein
MLIFYPRIGDELCNSAQYKICKICGFQSTHVGNFGLLCTGTLYWIKLLTTEHTVAQDQGCSQ